MNRRRFLTSSAAAVAVPAWLTSAAPRQPNLLYIISDELRFDALRCAGNGIIQTPNLDRLAAGGARFENMMCAFPVCVPSRTAMLTGRSSCNTHVKDNLAADDRENDPGPSFDNILHDHGYKTQYYGKWHAPYKLARTYDNRVATTHTPDLPDERRLYMAWLDQRFPARPIRKGERLANDYSRPYKPYPIDPLYEDAQAGIESDRKSKGLGQGDVFGILDVPREFTHAAYNADQAIRALDEMKAGPFSLTCSFNPPHPSYLAVEPYAHMYPWKEMPLPKNLSYDMTYAPYRLRAEKFARYHNPDYVRQFISVYYGQVSELDNEVGRILNKLDELGLTEKTLVIFTADHGEMLGSHGQTSKMTFLEEAVHVPLLMRLPSVIPAKTVVRHPVSGMDMFATVLDYLGVPAPARDGDSIRPLINGQANAGIDFRVAEWGQKNVPAYMVRTVDWKLMIADSPRSAAVDALFDLRNDPYEMRNLLGLPEDRAKYRGRAEEMKERLIGWLQRVHSPSIEGVKARKLG
jgi:arylsulfatase A-like enzyme